MAKSGFKYISFGGLIATIVLLITATIIEKLEGSHFALNLVYHSPIFIALLGITAISALLYIIRLRQIRLFLLHAALATILSGAFISHLTAEHGEIILAKEAVPASMFIDDKEELKKLPFRMMLAETQTLHDNEDNIIDYIAKIEIYDDYSNVTNSISMNKPIKKEGYTFCIKNHSHDAVSLLVTHDTWGSTVTYCGYTLFIIIFILTIIDRKSLFSSLSHKKESKKQSTTIFETALYIICTTLFIIIGTVGIIRWNAIELFPVTNGYEAMIFISWCGLLIGLITRKHNRLILPAMFTLAATSLLTATIAGNNNDGYVMPILRTPLLGLHVSCVILSYTLIGFLAINATVAIFYKNFSKREYKAVLLADTGRKVLYPATILLFTGIFIGAVWAEISWGRYWGWDPKEVWALITLLLCSLPFHTKSMPLLAKPMVFHYFCIILFWAMLFTYLGVNYFLGGMHAYL
ncbi:MAG: cytochrome c biogenesis protein CcsA [Bacteroidaceae bacterium]|nr:cytochrome c biogenesis protein CcsA [Bacteroidaceae bacterium]